MRALLFLYPIQPYLNFVMGPIDEEQWHQSLRMSRIIDERYRRRGWRIHWVLFSRADDSLMPDHDLFAEQLEIYPQDASIACGITLQKHQSGVYPNPVTILDQLPRTIDRLVVAGFHQWDCVDKLAECAYRWGIPTWVDEDLTELFFCHTLLQGPVPLVREPGDLSYLGFGDGDDDEFWIDWRRRLREPKPWFTQVP